MIGIKWPLVGGFTECDVGVACKSLLGVASMLGTWDVDVVVELVCTE